MQNFCLIKSNTSLKKIKKFMWYWKTIAIIFLFNSQFPLQTKTHQAAWKFFVSIYHYSVFENIWFIMPFQILKVQNLKQTAIYQTIDGVQGGRVQGVWMLFWYTWMYILIMFYNGKQWKSLYSFLVCFRTLNKGGEVAGAINVISSYQKFVF